MVDGRLRSLLRANSGRRLLLAAIVAFGLSLLGASGAKAQSTIKVLVFTGPSDATTDAGVAALQSLGGAHDFGVDVTQNAGAFTAANLAQYRAVVFLNNAGDRLDGAQESALQGYVNGGGGFVGIGGAAEAEPGGALVDGPIGPRPARGSAAERFQRRCDGRASGDGQTAQGKLAGGRGRRPRAPGDARPAARVDA